MKSSFIIIFSSIIMLISQTVVTAQNPIELGQVNWIRDIDQAVVKSKADQKPIFILFQEVPGCSTCRNYGQQVLSHPLIVEAIETLFVPLAIFNNKKGKDAETLTFFHEPAWNNPVVRIVDQQQKDLTLRVAGNYSIGGIVDAMISSLESINQEVPEYLRMMQIEFSTKEITNEAFFSMFCFWTGEKIYGAMHGVGETEAGFMDGKEVVRVRYNPTQLSLSELVRQGTDAGSADYIYLEKRLSQIDVQGVDHSRIRIASDFRPDAESKYYLRQSMYRFIPMTPLQATRMNSLIGRNESVDHLLSGRQLQVLKWVKENPQIKYKNVVGIPIEVAWKEVEKFL